MSLPMYEALNEERREIRPLVLEPFRDTDTEPVIECSMKKISLNENPQYVALSYVWGSTAVTEDIVVNGSFLPVTINLARALWQLEGLSDLLWVDAICINQRDIEERSAQVRMMGDIYRNATVVISWLGPEADKSSEAMIALRSIAQEVRNLGEGDDKTSWLERYPELFGDSIVAPTPWEPIKKLWLRDYWKRLYLGMMSAIDEWSMSIPTSMKAPDFIDESVWRLFASQGIFKPKPIVRNQILRDIWHHRKSKPWLSTEALGILVLEIGLDLQATDPRDKVYGFLALAQTDINPDYAKPVKEVFLEATLKFLGSHGLTRTLNLTHIDHGKDLDLPSWVIDWSGSKEKISISHAHRENEVLERGASNFRFDVSTPGILVVYGMRLCRISEVEPGPPMDALDGGFVEMIWRLCRKSLGRYREQTYRTGIPILQAILRLLLDDKDPLNKLGAVNIPSDAFFRLGATFVGLLCTLVSGEAIGSSIRENFQLNLPKLGLAGDQNFTKTFSKQFLGDTAALGPWADASEIYRGYGYSVEYLKVLDRIMKNLDEKQFFHTEDGYLGIVPDIVHTNDIVCALKGCRFPVILRQVESHFVLVGTCLIQGLMDGKLRKALEENDGAIQEFMIH